MTTVPTPAVDLSATIHHRLTHVDYDRLPIGTLLIKGELHRPQVVYRIVKPIDSRKYPTLKLTPEKRLLLYFWSVARGAIKSLAQPGNTNFLAVIQPGTPGWIELDGFKTLCDHRRGHVVDTALLKRGLEKARATLT